MSDAAFVDERRANKGVDYDEEQEKWFYVG
jgi:hypothetical protein